VAGPHGVARKHQRIDGFALNRSSSQHVGQLWARMWCADRGGRRRCRLTSPARNGASRAGVRRTMLVGAGILEAMGRDLSSTHRRGRSKCSLPARAAAPRLSCGHIASVSCCWLGCYGPGSRRRKRRRRGRVIGVARIRLTDAGRRALAGRVTNYVNNP
jgi:hypothetical protein